MARGRVGVAPPLLPMLAWRAVERRDGRRERRRAGDRPLAARRVFAHDRERVGLEVDAAVDAAVRCAVDGMPPSRLKAA